MTVNLWKSDETAENWQRWSLTVQFFLLEQRNMGNIFSKLINTSDKVSFIQHNQTVFNFQDTNLSSGEIYRFSNLSQK